jgi:hypothetical protein
MKTKGNERKKKKVKDQVNYFDVGEGKAKDEKF